MSKRLKSHVELNVDDALEGSEIPAAVFLPPAIKNKRIQVIYQSDDPEPVDVKAQIVRIQSQLDPIGMMMAIAAGQPVATFRVGTDGKVTIEYETLSLKDRLSLIMRMGDKVLPRMTMVAVKNTTAEPNEKSGNSWHGKVERAAREKQTETED